MPGSGGRTASPSRSTRRWSFEGLAYRVVTRPQWNHTLLETKKNGLMSIFYTIPQSHCVVIQRFGKFARIQEAGLRFRIPIMEQIRRVDDWGDVANKRGFMIEQTE